MNTEEKAKAYDEALNGMREIYPELYGAAKEYIEHFFPELKESEDERALRIIRKRMCYDPVPISDEDRRIVEHWLEKQKECLADNSKTSAGEDEKIRKWIFDLVNNMSFENLTASERAKNEEWKKKILAYLEKQKVNTEGDFGRGYDCGYQAGYAVAVNEMKQKVATVTLDSEKQKDPHYTKRNALFDKCVEKCNPDVMKKVSDDVDRLLQKEQKPVKSDTEKEYVRILKSIVSDFIRDKKPKDALLYQDIFDWLDGRHIEQKPTSQFHPGDWVVYDGPLGHAILQIEDVLDGRYTFVDNDSTLLVEDSDKFLRPITPEDVEKKSEWSEEDIKKIRSEEYTKGFNDAAFGSKLKEWSVEDEDRIRQIERIAQEAGCTQKLQEEIHDWLKSLRPSWKPSDEQMNALDKAIPVCMGVAGRDEVAPLESLYEQLKSIQ